MQITKLSFLSTQAVGDNVFAIEEILEVPIDQIFGTHRAREKALFNFIDSDAVQKVSRDTWRITKDITLDAANVKMRQGDYFRVRLDEEGDDSPIHFGLDATGVFVLSRAVFASLQTYRVLEPGKLEKIRMQFTFGGNPVVDAKLTNKFSSMSLVPVDATAGIYELEVYTAMAPSDDQISIEITGTSLNNNVYEAPVRITVREPVLTIVPIDVVMAEKQTKTVSWQLLMEGNPAPVAIPVQAQADPLIDSVLSFTLVDPAKAIYEMEATAGDTPGTSQVIGTYDFGRGYITTKDVDVTISVAPGVFITPDTTILEANQTQLIRFYAKWSKDSAPVTNAMYSTTDIRGPGLQNVEAVLVAIDAAAGLYGYRVTTNHKGGPVSVRTNITSDGIPYPVFFDLTSKSTPVQAVALNTLPAADAQYLTFRVQQERLGGLIPLVGVIAKQFTVTGSPVVGVQGAVEAVGQGVYRLKVFTNDRGGVVNVSAVLTIDGVDVTVNFTTTAAALSQATVISTSSALVGETTQPVPLEIRFEGKPYDIGSPTFTINGSSLISYGSLRRVGVGKYEIQNVNVNGKGGILNILVSGTVQGFSQTMTTTVAVDPVSNVVASKVTHYRPTTQGPLQFTALRDGVALPLVFAGATLTGGGVQSYTGIVETLDANTGRYQVRNVVASAPASQAPIGVSIPYKLKAYSYTLVFNTYTEAMPILTVDTKGVIPPGSVKSDYLLYFSVDGQLVDITSGTVQGAGSSFVSIDSPNLEGANNFAWAVKGLLPTADRGNITLSGTVLIDGITYPWSTTIRTKDVAPSLDTGSLGVLEPEVYQTVTFKLSKKGLPVGDATLSNGRVNGDAIESFDGFALQDAATGTYRFNVVTNGKGGPVAVDVDITLDGDIYPTHFSTTAKPGKVWGLTSGTTLQPAVADQSIEFSVTNDGNPVRSPYLRALDVTGSAVRSALKNIVPRGSIDVTTYATTGIRTSTAAGDVILKVQASTNNINWHDLDHSWSLPQAAAPIAQAGPMVPAVATSIVTVRVTRNGKPLFNPTFQNLKVTGAAVDTATLDWVKLNANGTYGTTVKTNDKGGPIDITFDVIDDGVTYTVTATGQADIVRPWTATLISSAPKPENLSVIDFQSMYGGAPVAMTNVKLRLVGNCVVSPTDEISAIYQDGTNQIYRMPNVMVNNDGGPITLEITGTVFDQQVSTVLQMVVTPLPAMQIKDASGTLPFRQTVDWLFDVNRGAGNPTLFNSSDVTNLNVQGNALAGYTPTVIPVGNGRYKISVQTNSVGGPVSASFDVTIAGQTTSLNVQTVAAVEPPVTAVSLNTLETNSTATNMDFQLMRGAVPCADAFVVKSVKMTSRSITAYPQSVLNVDVATGKYRMQVNTSSYNDPVTVEIQATVRGDDVTLTFTVQVKQGVLPTVSLSSDSFIYNVQSSGTLAFMQGSTAISGITVDSITGPLEDWSVSGNTLTGKPTAKGQSTLTVNFYWKSALYSGDITINPVNSIIVTPIGDPKLKAYVANKVNFPLVQEDGTAYPGTATFTVSAGPFTATPLNKEADGTYSLNLTYAGELLPTNIVVTATNGLAVTKHIIAYSVWFNFEARFSGTSLLDSSQVSNLVQFDVYEKNSNSVKDVYAGTDKDSLDVNAAPDVVLGYSTFQILSATRYRGTFFVSTNPVDLADPTFQFFWTSPLGRKYTIGGKFRVQKAILATWNATNLTGGDPATIQFYLKSGAAAINDAVDAGTVVTGATVSKVMYVVDAAAGLYAIDVVPNGNTSSMAITLKVKQQINNLMSTLDVNTFSVTPGAYAVVQKGPDLVRQIESQNLDVSFTQGGVALTGVTVNSVSFTGAIISMGTATAIAGGVYRFPTVVSLDKGTPHIVFNLTVAGVGMILEMDYPIGAPAVPTLTFYPMPTWTRGQQATTVKYRLTLGVNTYSVTNNAGTPYDTAAFKVSDGSDTFVLQGVQGDGTGGYLVSTLTPMKAGSVDLKLDVSMNGVVYHTVTPVTVIDAGIIVFDGTYNFEANVETTVNFHLDPPAGVTFDPTAIPTLTTPPFPITQAITSNGNGTYTMKVKPTGETLGVAVAGSIVSGGTTYNLGGPVSPARYRMSWSNNPSTGVVATELAGGVARTVTVAIADAVTDTRLGWAMDGTTSTISNLRVTADADAIGGTPTISQYNAYHMIFNVVSKQVDFATLTWKADLLSAATGFLYKDIVHKSVVHDNVTIETVTQPKALLNNVKGEIQFKMKWAKSGNPVKNAIFGTAHTVTGGVPDAVLTVIDADQGLYSVPVTPNAGVTQVVLTPKWTYPNGWVVYSGATITVPVSAGIIATQPMFSSPTATNVNGIYSQALMLKVDSALGDMSTAVLTGLTLPSGFLTVTGSLPATPFSVEERLFRVMCTSKAVTGTPATSYPFTATVNIGGVDYTLGGTYQFISPGVNIVSSSTLTTAGGELVLTPSVGIAGMDAASVAGWDLYDRNGVKISGGTGDNTYGTDGKIRIAVPALPAMKNVRAVVRMLTAQSVIGGDFDVQQVYGTTITGGSQ